MCTITYPRNEIGSLLRRESTTLETVLPARNIFEIYVGDARTKKRIRDMKE